MATLRRWAIHTAAFASDRETAVPDDRRQHLAEGTKTVNRVFNAAVAAAWLCGLSTGAHATYVCGVPTQTLGETGTNPVISTTLTRNGVDWSVIHTLKDGRTIEQFDGIHNSRPECQRRCRVVRLVHQASGLVDSWRT